MPKNWSECRSLISRRWGEVPQILLALDFDGTLAPIVDCPELATIPRRTQEALDHLAMLPDVRFAIVSGRRLEDVAARIIVPEAFYCGNHGLEMRGGGFEFFHPDALSASVSLDGALAELQSALAEIQGAEIENKGLTLTCHFRRASLANHATIAAHAERVARGSNLELRAAKMAWEFRPIVPWDKGSAIQCILEHLGLPSSAAVYLGDDATDEDAFRKLRPEGMTFHVGHLPESQAEFEILDTEETAEFLEWLWSVRSSRR